MGDGGFAFPLYSVRMKRRGLWIADYDRWPSRLAEDGRWWLRFPFVLTEDETMWTMIVGPLG